jgi:thiopeptide-type bacteriocin biosynthesis protein
MPGNGWLYLRVYARHADMTRLIVRFSREVADGLVADGSVDEWFFVRYGDEGGPHLRIRLHHATDRFEDVLRRCTGAFARYAGEKLVARVAVDTYVRELERYGGSAESCAAAETLFYLDSRRCVELLSAAEDQSVKAGAENIASLQPLLTALAGSSAEVVRLLGPGRREKLGPDERALVRTVATSLAARKDDALDETLRTRADALRANTAPDAFASVVASLVHMHFNRLGIEGATERNHDRVLRAAYATLVKRGAAEPALAVANLAGQVATA